jgi:hypothetical protein
MRPLVEVDNFGAIAAEDDDIKRFFVQTPVYDALMNGGRQVVIGRKGAGKTALYLAMLERAETGTSFARGLGFSDYPWALHSRYAHEITTRHERFLPSWKFLTAMEIFKVLLTETKRGTRYNDEARKSLKGIETFMQKNWGQIAFDYKHTFPGGGFDFSEFNVAPEVAGFALGGASFSRSGNLSLSLERLNEWLWSALALVAADAPPIYVLFDELDQGYDPRSDDYLDRVTGLLLAVRRMARDFRALGAPFYPVAFLRSDIYDALHFGDKNKLTEANVTELSWNDDLEYSGSSLKQLIDHRVREAMAISSQGKDAWGMAFDDAVMRGTQHKFHHVTFRTYLRPRDVIKFANCALERFKQRYRADGGDARITNADLIAARAEYSRYLQSELDDEIASSVPEWSDYLEVLRMLRVTRFTREAFAEAYRKSKSRIKLEMNPDELLAFFYEYSIIGFETAPGAAGLSEQFRYLNETVRFQPDARSFIVHRGLKEALELRDTGSAIDTIGNRRPID